MSVSNHCPVVKLSAVDMAKLLREFDRVAPGATVRKIRVDQDGQVIIHSWENQRFVYVYDVEKVIFKKWDEEVGITLLCNQCYDFTLDGPTFNPDELFDDDDIVI